MAIIRPAAERDRDGVLALYPFLNPDDPPLDEATAQAAWRRIIESGCTTVFVAEAAVLVAATCTLSVIPNLTRAARPYGLIENVVTHPDHRRTGLGRAVLQAALDAAWAAGCYKVMLASGSRQEATLRFYEGAGFERGGKTFFQARAAG